RRRVSLEDLDESWALPALRPVKLAAHARARRPTLAMRADPRERAYELRARPGPRISSEAQLLRQRTTRWGPATFGLGPTSACEAGPTAESVDAKASVIGEGVVSGRLGRAARLVQGDTLEVRPGLIGRHEPQVRRV